MNRDLEEALEKSRARSSQTLRRQFWAQFAAAALSGTESIADTKGESTWNDEASVESASNIASMMLQELEARFPFEP